MLPICMLMFMYRVKTKHLSHITLANWKISPYLLLSLYTEEKQTNKSLQSQQACTAPGWGQSGWKVAQQKKDLQVVSAGSCSEPLRALEGQRHPGLGQQ